MEGRFITPLSVSLPKTSSDEKHQAYHTHVAKNSVVDPFTDACPFQCIFASFLADSSTSCRAVHTMKARGDDDNDEDSNESNNSNDKVWDEDEDEDDEQ